MPESIGSGKAKYGWRILYVRDINNWIKAKRVCTSESLTVPNSLPVQPLMLSGETRHCAPVAPSSSSLLPFLRSFPDPRCRLVDNFLIAELDVVGGDSSD